MKTPLQNRMNPHGELEAVKARGAWLGNRGILHNDKQEIIAPWRHKAWITCELQFKNRKRSVFSPGTYSELFFLDEATAYSAGHRPCGECRREDFKAFKQAWLQANRNSRESEGSSIVVIDRQLHEERAIRGGGKLTYSEELRNLPDGVFIKLEGRAVLIWRGHLHTWSHHGYIEKRPFASSRTRVEVLTPKSVVAAIHEGLKVEVHNSLSN